MIKINDRFEFERQQYCWNLYEWKDGVGKDAQPKRTKSVTYHATLSHICKEVVDRSAGDAESMQELLNVIDSAVLDLSMAIKG